MHKRHKMIQLVLVGGICALIFTIIIGEGMFSRAAVFIESNPKAEVYIDNNYQGLTPIEIERSDRNFLLTVKVSESETADSPLSYSTQMNLEPGVKTIVRREFREEDSGASTGVLVSYRKNGLRGSAIEIVATPKYSGVYLNGEFKGVTPLLVEDVDSNSQYDVTVVSFGRRDIFITVQTEPGYTTTLYAELGNQINPKNMSNEELEGGSNATIENYYDEPEP